MALDAQALLSMSLDAATYGQRLAIARQRAFRCTTFVVRQTARRVGVRGLLTRLKLLLRTVDKVSGAGFQGSDQAQQNALRVLKL